MLEMVILVAVALCLSLAATLRFTRKTADVPLATVANEDLDSFAERFVSAVWDVCSVEGIALRRSTEGSREIASKGRPVSVRDVWIGEIRETRRAVTVDGTALFPLGADAVEGALVIRGALSARERKRVEALVQQAGPIIADLMDHPCRSTMRLIQLAQSSDLDMVFEAVADGLAVTDDEGHVVRVNAAGREILAAARAADGQNPLSEALGEGVPTNCMEVAIGTGNGGSVIQLNMSRLSRLPDSRAVVAVMRDITRARTLEHELRVESSARARNVAELEIKHREVEAATRHKSEFLANMSHELRTPLNGIIGFAEILLEGTFGPLNTKQGECARDVLEGGRHLLALINDILDVSKIEAGKVELTKEDLSVEAVIANALTLVRPQAGRKQLSITTSIEPNVIVRGDADRIVQILLNLLSNAVKFTPATVGRVHLDVRAAETTVRIAVTDTGVGIAEADQCKLFKDFSQVDGSITRRFGGTGLGLAICKRLVELHGGTIGFTSKIGEGSCFWFELPRGVRSEAPPFAVRSPLRASSVPHMRAVSGATRALVVDADGASRRIVANALRDAGIDSSSCATLAEARGLSRGATTVAVVIDPSLPDATEREALEFAVAEAGTAVVAMSTRAAAELKDTLPEGVRCLPKPLDRSLLTDEVSRAIARRSARQRSALVVDDEADGGAVIALLQSEGFRCERVGTLAAARRWLARTRPDILVVELDLADGDGLDLLREERNHEDLVTIVLTNRVLEGEHFDDVRALSKMTLQKGALSRSAFVRRLEAVLEPRTAGRARILAVDDNEQNLRLLTAVLSARGYHVTEARDATSAIDFARAEKPDLVLMDVMLPGLDGLSATRTLAADPLTKDTPVIAISANAMAEDHDKARAAGCAAYVTKPIDVRSLLEVMTSVLRGKFIDVTDSGRFG